MAIVSISEAARLAGKARSTLQTHIKTGKLSKTTGSDGAEGADTSELLRVYGVLEATATTCSDGMPISHQTTGSTAHETAAEITALKTENDSLRLLLESKQAHIDSLNKAMILLEKKPKNQENKALFWSFLRRKR